MVFSFHTTNMAMSNSRPLIMQDMQGMAFRAAKLSTHSARSENAFADSTARPPPHLPRRASHHCHSPPTRTQPQLEHTVSSITASQQNSAPPINTRHRKSTTTHRLAKHLRVQCLVVDALSSPRARHNELLLCLWVLWIESARVRLAPLPQRRLVRRVVLFASQRRLIFLIQVGPFRSRRRCAARDVLLGLARGHHAAAAGGGARLAPRRRRAAA